MTKRFLSLAQVAILAILVIAPLAVRAAQQESSFGATVARVRVDVIVTDEDGRFVDDLRPGDFALFEDESRQEVLGVQVVDLLAGTITSLRGTEFQPPIAEPSLVGDAGVEPAAGMPAPVADSRASDFGAIIYVIDLPGMDRQHKERFASAWLSKLEQTESFAIPRGAYMIDQVGELQELAPLTFNVAHLRRAAETIFDTRLTRNGLQEQIVTVADNMLAAENLDFAIVETTTMNELRALEAQERGRTVNTFDLLTQFCNALSMRRGRTALVWVTSEIQTTEGGVGTALASAYQDSRDILGEEPGAQQQRARRTGSTQYAYMTPDPQIVERQRRFYDAANSANVSVYALDPLPAGEMRSMAYDMRVLNPTLRNLLDSATVQNSFASLKDGLFEAASETGGQAYVGATEIDEALESISRDASRFYLLSYEPPLPHGDGEYHTIRVEVSRPGLDIRARKGYVDLSPEVRRSASVMAALAVPGAVSGLPFNAKAYIKWSSSGEPVVQLVVAPAGDPSKLRAFATTAEGISHQFHAVAVDESGRVLTEVHQEMRALGTALASDNSLQRAPVYVHEWSIPPGKYELRIALQDGLTGEIGATYLPVEVPRVSALWSTSDLILMVAGNSNEPRPLVVPLVSSDETVFTYVEVWGGQNPILSGDILTPDGITRLAILPDLPLGRDRVGIHRAAHMIRGMPPGEYLLRIVVVDPGMDEEKVMTTPLTVLPSPNRY
jgi:VWFA-related protein